MAHGKPSSDPLFQNWIKAALLLKFGKDAISEFLETVLDKFRLITVGGNCAHVCHSCTIFNVIPCQTKKFCNGGKKCKKHDTNDVKKTYRPCPNNVCDKLYLEIKKQFASFEGPSWSQSDATLWCSNVWEIAKCFMSGEYQDKHNIEEYDFGGIISLIINCKFIQSQLSKPYVRQDFRKVIDVPFCKPDHSFYLYMYM